MAFTSPKDVKRGTKNPDGSITLADGRVIRPGAADWIERTGDTIGSTVEKGAKATGRGIAKGAQATARAAGKLGKSKVGRAISFVNPVIGYQATVGLFAVGQKEAARATGRAAAAGFATGGAIGAAIATGNAGGVMQAGRNAIGSFSDTVTEPDKPSEPPKVAPETTPDPEPGTEPRPSLLQQIIALAFPRI